MHTTHQTKHRKRRLTNPKPYDQLINKNSATNSSGKVNQNRSKSLPQIVSSAIIDTEVTEYLNVTVSKCKQTMTTGLKAATLRLTSQNIDLPPIQRRGITIDPEVQEGDKTITNPIIEARALLDTGSLPGNFITVDLLKRINGTDGIYKTDHLIRVCSGLDNHCIDSTDVVDVLVSFKSKINKYSIKLTCRISLTGLAELIIRRHSINKQKLVSLLPNFFFNEDIGK
jgi:hypothetical protein